MSDGEQSRSDDNEVIDNTRFWRGAPSAAGQFNARLAGIIKQYWRDRCGPDTVVNLRIGSASGKLGKAPVGTLTSDMVAGWPLSVWLALQKKPIDK